jgi:hypothetical protein
MLTSGWRLPFFIAEKKKRIPITFEDPKAFDNTHKKRNTERSIQIATELFYVFSQIKNNMSATNCTPALTEN